LSNFSTSTTGDVVKEIPVNFFKDGKVLTVSIVEENHMTYPDEDEMKELFGEK